MKIPKSIKHTVFVLLISAKFIFSQDFKIAPKTPLLEGDKFFNVSIASDENNGFLVTWILYRKVGSTVYFKNYASRFSKNGQMLDSTAIYLCDSYWPSYMPNAVFKDGNWIIAMNRGGLFEWVGAMRLTSSGTLLDSEPVNIMQSVGQATVEYPTLATNGREILCLSGIAGDSLSISIFDADLNILLERKGIYPGIGNAGDAIINYDHPFGVTSNTDNFYITFLSTYNGKNNVKLIIVSSKGEVLSTQTVFDNFYTTHDAWGLPAITSADSTIYVTFFNRSKLFLRRYNADGTPNDPSSFQICNFIDFKPILTQYAGGNPGCGYIDWIYADDSFSLFWPKNDELSISMINFESDFSDYRIRNLNSHCQYDPGDYTWEDSFSYIQAASIGTKVLTAWIDGREGNSTRIYGNFFDVNMYTWVNQEDDQMMIPINFSISQNYPNPFNSETTIHYQLHEPVLVTLEVYNTNGEMICTLVNKQQPVGFYFVRWNGEDEKGAAVASGVYLYQLKVGQYVLVKKMLLVR